MRRGSADAIKQLIKEQKHEDFMVVDRNQNNYLHVLAEMPKETVNYKKNFLFCLEQFLELGVDFKQKNSKGEAADDILKQCFSKAKMYLDLFEASRHRKELLSKLFNIFSLVLPEKYSEKDRDKDLEVLNLKPKASRRELRKAYFKCALKYHPDRNEGLSPAEKVEKENKFKIIQSAYERLIESTFYRDRDVDDPSEEIPIVISSNKAEALASEPFTRKSHLFGLKNIPQETKEPDLKKLVKLYFKAIFDYSNSGGSKRSKFLQKIKDLLATEVSIKLENGTLLHKFIHFKIKKGIIIGHIAELEKLLFEAACKEQCLEMADSDGNTPLLLCLNHVLAKKELFQLEGLIINIIEKSSAFDSIITSKMFSKLLQHSENHSLKFLNIAQKIIEHAPEERFYNEEESTVLVNCLEYSLKKEKLVFSKEFILKMIETNQRFRSLILEKLFPQLLEFQKSNEDFFEITLKIIECSQKELFEDIAEKGDSLLLLSLKHILRSEKQVDINLWKEFIFKIIEKNISFTGLFTKGIFSQLLTQAINSDEFFEIADKIIECAQEDSFFNEQDKEENIVLFAYLGLYRKKIKSKISKALILKMIEKTTHSLKPLITEGIFSNLLKYTDFVSDWTEVVLKIIECAQEGIFNEKDKTRKNDNGEFLSIIEICFKNCLFYSEDGRRIMMKILEKNISVKALLNNNDLQNIFARNSIFDSSLEIITKIIMLAKKEGCLSTKNEQEELLQKCSPGHQRDTISNLLIGHK